MLPEGRKPDRPRPIFTGRQAAASTATGVVLPSRQRIDMAGRGSTSAVTTNLDKFAYQKDQADTVPHTETVSTSPVTTSPNQDITLLDIMGLLQQMQSSMGAIATDINLIRADMAKFTERIKAVETTTELLTTDTKALKQQVLLLETETQILKSKLDEQEGRSRRNNIRLIGVPEKVGGQALDLFVEELVTKRLQPRGLSKFFSIERAHRVPGGPAKPGANPRPVLARLFNFRDRDVILQEARVAPPIRIDNSTITIYPDYTAAVAQRRRTFLAIKRDLRAKEIKYSMMFPAKLRVEAEGKTWFFTTPEEAREWLEGWRTSGKTKKASTSR